MISSTGVALMDARAAMSKNNGTLSRADAAALKTELVNNLSSKFSKDREVAQGLGAFLAELPVDKFESASDRAELKSLASEQWKHYEANRGGLNRFLDYHLRDVDADGIKDGNKAPFEL